MNAIKFKNKQNNEVEIDTERWVEFKNELIGVIDNVGFIKNLFDPFKGQGSSGHTFRLKLAELKGQSKNTKLMNKVIQESWSLFALLYTAILNLPLLLSFTPKIKSLTMLLLL